MSGTSGDLFFFLGAGASVKAGVPDTFGLVDEFRVRIKDQTENSKALERILGILRDWKRANGNHDDAVDIELLLETLERLDTRSRDVLLRFYDVTRYKLSDYEKQPLIAQLKDFIKTAGIVLAVNVTYLEPFLGFMTDYKPLDVFSVNYDTSVEQFCNAYKKNYTDGFDIKWNPKLLEENRFDLRLYKLHGSIMWYRTDRGDYDKILIQSERSAMQLITGEKAETLILYPMRKWEYAEPLLELLFMLKRRLENAKFAIVVGYSFRDDHIRNVFWDAANKNRELTVVLISPSAHKIYSERLKAYDSASDRNLSPIPSALSGRVVCLPYKYEDIFPELRNRFLKRLREGLSLEGTEARNEVRGERANWMEVLKAYVECNHMERVQEIEAKMDLASQFTVNPALMVELTIRSVLNYANLEEYEQALRWYNQMRQLIMYNPLTAEVMRSTELVVRASFKISDSSFSSFKQVYDQTRNTFEDFKSKTSMMQPDRLAEVGSELEAFEQLNRYLAFWSPQQDGYVAASQYIEKRKERYPSEISEFAIRCNEYAERMETRERNKSMEIHAILVEIVRKIETKEIRSIFEIAPAKN
jgi:hypothetical protein